MAIFYASVTLFILLSGISIVSSTNTNSNKQIYTKHCNSNLQSNELLHDYVIENFGCTVDCVILISSNSGGDKRYYDQTDRRKHLLSNIQCVNDTYVSNENT